MTTDGATDYEGGSVAKLGVSLKGCPLVLNIGHWTTMQSYVSNHTAGQRNFTYDSRNCGERDCPAERHPGDGKGRYFVESCPAVLDAEGEWAYNGTSPTYGGQGSGGTLLLKSATLDPNNATMYGKNLTYALVVKNSERVTVKVSCRAWFRLSLLSHAHTNFKFTINVGT